MASFTVGNRFTTFAKVEKKIHQYERKNLCNFTKEIVEELKLHRKEHRIRILCSLFRISVQLYSWGGKV